MKLILFDLGRTLEDGDVLRPGALETLKAIESMRAGDQPAALLGLVSDFDMTTDPAEVPIIQQRYFRLLDQLGIRSFFEPVEERVTLSTEVGVSKPDPAIFRAAVTKAHLDLRFADTLFVTENLDHVLAARELGLAAVHLRAPGQPHGEVDTLPELVPIVRAFVGNEDPIDAIIVPVRSDAADAVLDRAAAVGVSWTRLGDELVVRGPAAQVTQLLGGSDVARSVPGPGVPGQRLHLVTQIGRQFQHDHPDVPVVVDKGRYLVVDLDPRARLLANDVHSGCYAVRPLPADTVVFAQRDPAQQVVRAREAGGPADELSRAAFEADLGTLATMRTRHSAGAQFLDALEWARNRLAGLGYDTHVQTVTLDNGTTRNLVADRTGEGDARGVVLVTAHLDSVNRQGPTAAAPGADDNASGAAGVIAIGTALAHQAATHDLRLVLFGGEEQGLFGSRQYVSGLDAAERARIIAVVNMDMIACLNTEAPTVLLEGAATSQAVIDALADAAHAHTSLVVQTSLAPFNSDHVPFLDQGIAAVLTIEGADGANDRVHTERDTLESLDVDLALQILRMNVAFVARAMDGSTVLSRPSA